MSLEVEHAVSVHPTALLQKEIDVSIPVQTESKEGEQGKFEEWFCHGYQPNRSLFAPDGSSITVQVPPKIVDGRECVEINKVFYPYENGKFYVAKFDKWYDDINMLIHDQSYKPILVEGGMMPGLTFSFFRSLRHWMQEAVPQDYAKIVENIHNLPNPEWQVLVDPGDHLILPHRSKEGQDTQMKIGIEGMRRDLGVVPKGAWPPETALAMTTLESYVENGIVYTVARSDQLASAEHNPMFVETGSGDIAIFHFDMERSGSIAFQDWVTFDADRFMQYWRDVDARSIAFGMDLETHGHHKEDRDKFLRRSLALLGEYRKFGLGPFDKEAMMIGERHYTTLHENSSWSCPHGLDRWTGGDNCSCDNPSFEARQDKKRFFSTLDAYDRIITDRLDQLAPSWRQVFVPLYLAVEEPATQGGNIWAAVEDLSRHEGMELLADRNIASHMLGEFYVSKGLTSCGWFFGEADRVERRIPKFGIETVEKLIPDIGEASSPPLAA